MELLLSWMRYFTIRARMQGAVVMVLAMFALVGLTGFLGGLQLQRLNADFMQHSVKKLTNLSQIRASLAELRLWEKEMIINYEDGVAVLKARERWQAALVATRQNMAYLLEGQDGEQVPLVQESIQLLADYDKASAPVLSQIQNGAYDTARTGDRLLGRAKGLIRDVETRVEKIATLIEGDAINSQQEFGRSMRNIGVVFLAVLALVVLLVVPLTLLNSRTITRPIGYARKVAEAIAAGDLNREIRVEGRDEAADLLASLKTMQHSLRTLVGEVRESTQYIETASVEVAAGNQDLSQRTEQAASNLQQTASSMDELTRGLLMC